MRMNNSALPPPKKKRVGYKYYHLMNILSILLYHIFNIRFTHYSFMSYHLLGESSG